MRAARDSDILHDKDIQRREGFVARCGTKILPALFRRAAHSPPPGPDAHRRLSSPNEGRIGAGCGHGAAAHKVAIVFYTIVDSHVEYGASLWAQRGAMREKRFEDRLHKQAAQRGYKPALLEPARVTHW